MLRAGGTFIDGVSDVKEQNAVTRAKRSIDTLKRP